MQFILRETKHLVLDCKIKYDQPFNDSLNFVQTIMWVNGKFLFVFNFKTVASGTCKEHLAELNPKQGSCELLKFSIFSYIYVFLLFYLIAKNLGL